MVEAATLSCNASLNTRSPQLALQQPDHSLIESDGDDSNIQELHPITQELDCAVMVREESSSQPREHPSVLEELASAQTRDHLSAGVKDDNDRGCTPVSSDVGARLQPHCFMIS